SVYGNDSYPYEPENEINYNLVTPLQLALSLGYVFPEVASLTFDCEMTPYGMARYSNTEGDAKIIDQNNDLIKAEGKVGGAVRLGSEFYVWKGWIARLGAGYHTASSTWIGSSFNIGAGAGYNFGHALIDLSYVYQSQNHEYYSLYNGLEQPVAVKTTYIKQFVALSLAYRF
ncbi:MAG: hypothetical protein LBT49_06285, partial [Prevotellaceae bacterium]|nr:hypothetical protein [Prevotellaceae bacterium]